MDNPVGYVLKWFWIQSLSYLVSMLYSYSEPYNKINMKPAIKT